MKSNNKRKKAPKGFKRYQCSNCGVINFFEKTENFIAGYCQNCDYRIYS